MQARCTLPLSVLAALFSLVSSISPVHAQSPVRPQSSADSGILFKTVESLDARLFDAYNHCDLATVASLVADDLEFYHDKTGLARGRQSLLDGLRNNVCGKVTRELVPGTLEVYPIAGYGAVEMGVHRFHHPGHENTGSAGEAKFVQLWQNKDGHWRLTRVISFDHRSIAR